MAEYIDKAALVSEVEKNKLMAREPAARRILEIIKGATVFVGVGLNDDVAPVRHGRWEGYMHSRYCGCDEAGEPIYRDGVVYYCSNRKCRRKTIIREKYCPNCGAKMDGGEENEM